jgi:antitoxin component YwqK of YwqJK toxin-antitoxin module
MRIIFIVSFCILHFIPCSGQQDTISETHKESRWVYLGLEKPDSLHFSEPYTGHHINYTKDSIKHSEGSYINGKKTDLWIVYFDDGVTPKLKGEYRNNRPYGNYIKYYQNGNVKEKGFFTGKMKHDNFKRFLEDGRLEATRTTLENGTKIDSFYYYFESKCLDQIITYNNANNIIETITYSKDSCNLMLTKTNSSSNKITPCMQEEIAFEYMLSNKVDSIFKQKDILKTESVQTFVLDSLSIETSKKHQGGYTLQLIEKTIRKNDLVESQIHLLYTKGERPKLNGFNKLYNEDNEIYIDGEFTNGALTNGKVYLYDELGILLKVKIFKQGKYDSDGQP